MARRTLVEQDRVELERLEAATEKLRDEGRHPDQWLSEHGERAARWAAVERELAIRRELEAEMDGHELEPDPPGHELEPDLPEPPGIEM